MTGAAHTVMSHSTEHLDNVIDVDYISAQGLDAEWPTLKNTKPKGCPTQARAGREQTRNTMMSRVKYVGLKGNRYESATRVIWLYAMKRLQMIAG